MPEIRTNAFKFKEEESSETCPNCGRPLIIANVFGKPYHKMCPCEEEQNRKHRQSVIEKGTELYRAQIRAESGLLGVWLEKSMDRYNPREGQFEAAAAARDFVARYKAGYTIKVPTEQGYEKAIKNKKGLLLIGSTGCGKTHIACAIANAVSTLAIIPEEDALVAGNLGIIQHHINPVKFINTVNLMTEIKASFSKDRASAGEIITPYQTTGVLILDDVGAEKASEWTQEKLYEIIEFRNTYEKPMIITTNLKPADLQQWLGDRNYDRIRESCKMVAITAPGQRETA